MSDKKEFVKLLICPLTGEPLHWLTEEALNTVQQRIKNQTLHCQHDTQQGAVFDGALQAGDKDIYYGVQQGIFYLLPELAIIGNIEDNFEQDNLKNTDQQTKKQVKKFYDTFGWQQQAGIYQDAKDSEDLRAVSQEYITQCHARVKKHLPPSGKYLLDVACGPIQYAEYVTYSENFDYRICADISLTALRAAKAKLGEKGIYLLCDVTCLPLAKNSIDAVVSLHTLYHVPKEEQAQAFKELYRVLMPEGISAIVYSWGGRSVLMNAFLFPVKILSYLKRKCFKPAHATATLYFYAHNYAWFCDEIKKKYGTQLFAWRSVNVPFLKIFIHPALGGKRLLKTFFWLENRFPKAMGRWGAYPLLISKKTNP